MKNYELTYIASPELSEGELKNLSEKVNGFLQEELGLLDKMTEPSKTKLGYPMKKKTGGFLITINFSLNPEKLENLEKKLKKENQILRYIILIKKAKEELPRPRRTLQGFAKRVFPKEITEPKKVELKEIDKKIEEILKE